MSVPDAKLLKDLEAENTRLKKLLAEQVFENDVIKDALRKSGDRTGAQAAAAEHGREGVERTTSAGGSAHERQRVAICAQTRQQRRAS